MIFLKLWRGRDTQITTWHKVRAAGVKTRKKEPGIHNQIDYIVVPKHMIRLFTDAKAAGQMTHRSDHSLAVGKALLKELRKTRRAQKVKERSRDLTALVHTELAEECRDASYILD